MAEGLAQRAPDLQLLSCVLCDTIKGTRFCSPRCDVLVHNRKCVLGLRPCRGDPGVLAHVAEAAAATPQDGAWLPEDPPGLATPTLTSGAEGPPCRTECRTLGSDADLGRWQDPSWGAERPCLCQVVSTGLPVVVWRPPNTHTGMGSRRPPNSCFPYLWCIVLSTVP